MTQNRISLLVSTQTWGDIPFWVISQPNVDGFCSNMDDLKALSCWQYPFASYSDKRIQARVNLYSNIRIIRIFAGRSTDQSTGPEWKDLRAVKFLCNKTRPRNLGFKFVVTYSVRKIRIRNPLGWHFVQICYICLYGRAFVQKDWRSLAWQSIKKYLWHASCLEARMWGLEGEY